MPKRYLTNATYFRNQVPNERLFGYRVSMTLQQLRYLIAVADHGSITAAASAVYVAQPALSRAVRAPERELNIELLSRDGRKSVPTPEAKRVVRLAGGALRVVDTIAELGTPEPPRPGATLTVVATPTLASDLIGAMLPAFSRCHPDIHVDVTGCDSREKLVDALRTGAADLAVVDLPVDREFKAHQLRTREVALVSPAGRNLPDPVPFDRLDGLPMVLPTRRSGRRREFEEMFAFLQVQPVPAVETDERVAWVAGVLDGKGSLLWYRDVAVRAFGQRAEIRSFDPPLGRPVGIVHARHRLAPAAHAFLDVARSEELVPTFV